MKLLGASLVVAALAAGVAGGQPSPPPPRGAVTLALTDLEHGYQVGDDGGCGPFGVEGMSPTLASFVARTQPSGCLAQLERAWPAARGRIVSPPLVVSGAIVFSNAADAHAGFLAAPALVGFTNGAHATFGRGRPAIGDEARPLVLDDLGVEGRPAQGAAVAWRTKNVVAFVVLGGVTGPAAIGRATALAGRQQARITSGVAAGVPKRLVGLALDDPRVAVPVYWLGRELDPRGVLPRLTLNDTYYARQSGPGDELKIDYGSRPLRGDVILDLWRPAAFARFRRSAVGRLVWDDPCTRRTTVTVRGGRALIYAGYAHPATGSCARPDRYLADVYLDGVVVTVNRPYAFCCTDASPSNPYNTLAGMTAVVRNLRLRRTR